MTAGGISLWAIVVLFLFTALPVCCISSAKEMPPTRGGVAGWLRWYAVCYAFYVAVLGPAALGGDQAAAVCLPLTLPFAIAVWIRHPFARTINLYGNYGVAILGLAALVAGNLSTLALIVSGLFWGTYFLRSERVRATYSLAT